MDQTVLLLVLSVGLVTGLLVCTGLILTQSWHGRLSMDFETSGAQKFHKLPVPRIGGVCILFGLAAGGAAWANLDDSPGSQMALTLLFCSLPAFIAGLVEDLTKKVSVSLRLLATFASAGFATWLLDAQLTRVDVYGIDTLMLYAPIAFVFTCFAVGGVANAVNIIDGFNGLAAGSAALMFAGLATIAGFHDDTAVMMLCLIGIMPLLGFLVWNFPFGKIFMGDGGAYLVGFWLAECCVLLLARNPEVSTWVPLLVCIYPVWETVFSMWRKSIHRGTGSGQPDRVHFHMLVFRRLIGQRLGSRSPAWMRHGATSLFIWSLVAGCQVFSIAAVFQLQGSMAFGAGILVFAVLYVAIYRSIVLGCQPSPEPMADPAVRAGL